MINGKFFTGLPANMVDRKTTCNRQESHFFWPDDTQNVSVVDSRIKRRASVQAESRNAYNNIARSDQSNSDAENKERFKKEFTKSSIQFYDNVVDETPARRDRKKQDLPPQKLQNIEPPENLKAKKNENLSSKIEFFDYAEDLNNVPKTNKNNKVELEKNSKNSPKLQNKKLSFDQKDDAINFIENDVKNLKITTPPRRRNIVRDSRPRYPRPIDVVDPLYSDIYDDYNPPRRRPMPPPIRARYPESDPDFEEYIPRRLSPRPAYYAREPLDYVDGHPSARNNYYNEGGVPPRNRGRHLDYRYSSANECNSTYEHSPPPPPAYFRMPRKPNISNVDNDIRNNEQRQMMMPPQPSSSSTTSKPPHQNNTCLSDTESAPQAPASSSTVPPARQQPPATKRNIRSSAVNRVSVGLPD